MQVHCLHPFSMSFTQIDISNFHTIPPWDLTIIHMTSPIGTLIIMFPSFHGNNQQETTLSQLLSKHPTIQKITIGNYNITQGSKITIPVSLPTSNHSWSTDLYQGNPFPDSLLLLHEYTMPYPYGYYSPLDVNLTHWSFENVPSIFFTIFWINSFIDPLQL
jgi:hypothetical protein